MNAAQIKQLFTGQEWAQIEDVARDMGITPDECVRKLSLAELAKNPMLIGPNSAESEHEISASRMRH